MSRHPLLVALEQLDDGPSVEFSNAMYERLFAELVHPSESSSDSIVDEELTRTEVDVQGEAARLTAFEPRTKHTGVLLARVATIILVAALAIAPLIRRPLPPVIDIHRDQAIAQSALITGNDLGMFWGGSHVFDKFTTRDAAAVAARIPVCAPYGDVFDSPGKETATSQKLYEKGIAQMWETIYLFPTKDAASQVMDKIAEPGFTSCFASFLKAASVAIPLSGSIISSEVVTAPPLLQHGDRQVDFGTLNSYVFEGIAGQMPVTSINIFIQVDRTIVFINPLPDFHNSLDPKSALEVAIRLAMTSLTNALESGT